MKDTNGGTELGARPQPKFSAFDDGSGVDDALLGIGGHQHARRVSDFATGIELVAREDRERGDSDGSETHGDES